MDFSKTKSPLFIISNILIALFILALLLSPFWPELVDFRLKIIGLFLINLSLILFVYLLELSHRLNYPGGEAELKKYLSRLPGIAKDWDHGGTETLDKYSFDLLENDIDYGKQEDSQQWSDLERIEDILRQSDGANIFLEGEGERLKEIVLSLIGEIKSGRIAPEIEHRRFMAMETPSLIRNFNEPAGLKREMERMLEEAERVANITLIIDGVTEDAFYSLQPFFYAPSVQTIITISSNYSYEYLNNYLEGIPGAAHFKV